MIIIITTGALGAVSNMLDAWLEKLGVTFRTGVLQKSALLALSRPRGSPLTSEIVWR